MVTILLSSPLIKAKKISKDLNISEINSTSPIWQQTSSSRVYLYPQKSIQLNDKIANSLNSSYKKVVSKVSAIYDNRYMIFRVVWSDDNRSVDQYGYSDAFAIEFVNDLNDSKRLPYIGMGSHGREVSIYYLRADSRVDSGKLYLSHGNKTMREVRDINSSFRMSMDHNGTHYIGMLRRELDSGYSELNSSKSFPISLAIWHGDQLQRAENKYISSWFATKFGTKKSSDRLVDELNRKPKGKIKKGKYIVENLCTSCHTVGDKNATIPSTAPNLSNVGGYSTIAYLYESIRDPSAAIVEEYSQRIDRVSKWYTVDDSGKKVSLMPPDLIEESMIDDVVAYLHQLKGDK
jgi:complex iron-sulfur molybdoenzyme family reductase subunit gamma